MNVIILTDVFLVLRPDQAVQVVYDNAHLLKLRHNQRIAGDNFLIDNFGMIPDRSCRCKNDSLAHVRENPRQTADGFDIVLVRGEDAVWIQIIEQMAGIPKPIVEVNDIRALDIS